MQRGNIANRNFLLRALTLKPLFIPLNKEHYEAFESGEKWCEYRVYGPRWNRKTCYAGRPVTLSCGYGKQRRMTGFITLIDVSRYYATRPEFIKIFGKDVPEAICIGIQVGKLTTT